MVPRGIPPGSLRALSLTPPTPARSAIMRAIKSTNTKPERLLASALRVERLRPKRHDGLRPGSPDFSFPRARLAVFVDGDFWHARGWPDIRKMKVPITNAAFWLHKLETNRARDRRNDRALRAIGWRVIRFWESDIARPERRAIAASIISLLVECRLMDPRVAVEIVRQRRRALRRLLDTRVRGATPKK